MNMTETQKKCLGCKWDVIQGIPEPEHTCTSAMTLDKRVEEIVVQWLVEEKKDNYVNTDCGLDSVCLDGHFDLEELTQTLTQHHQDRMSEVVEKLEDLKNKQIHQSDRMLITEAQTIIKSLSK